MWKRVWNVFKNALDRQLSISGFRVIIPHGEETRLSWNAVTWHLEIGWTFKSLLKCLSPGENYFWIFSSCSSIFLLSFSPLFLQFFSQSFTWSGFFRQPLSKMLKLEISQPPRCGLYRGRHSTFSNTLPEPFLISLCHRYWDNSESCKLLNYRWLDVIACRPYCDRKSFMATISVIRGDYRRRSFITVKLVKCVQLVSYTSVQLCSVLVSSNPSHVSIRWRV